jgi:hypothetical protein
VIIIHAAFCVSGFSVCFLAGRQAFGQITTSEIVGTVSDATGAVVMNAKVGSDGGFVLNPYHRSPYTVTVEALSPCRMLSNVIAYVEAEGIDASGAWVTASDIKTAATGRWSTCPRRLIARRGKRCFISTNRTCWNKP